ncbi:MAG: hypothetical protein N4A61_13265 [Pelagimonas sp.]|jgi:hypothetical protein|nr:hypothetical protein [Pelagimonas sp.]
MNTQIDQIIHRSVPKSLVLLVCCGVLVWLNLLLAQGEFVDTRRGALTVPLGWAGLVIFLVVGVVQGVSLVAGPKSPVRITETGFLDSRYFHTELPWLAIDTLAVHQSGLARVIRIKIKPEQRQALKLTVYGRVMGWMNYAFRSHELVLSANNLEIGTQAYGDRLNAYLERRNPNAFENT